MNHLTIIGNVCADAQLRVTQSGTNVCSFSVAVNERRGKDKENQTTFFRVSAWNRLAETCGKYVKKGMKIAVNGKVGISSYETNSGDKRSELTVLADDIEFLSRSDDKPENEQEEVQRAPAQAPQAPQNFVDVSSDYENDLPF